MANLRPVCSTGALSQPLLFLFLSPQVSILGKYANHLLLFIFTFNEWEYRRAINLFVFYRSEFLLVFLARRELEISLATSFAGAWTISCEASAHRAQGLVVRSAHFRFREIIPRPAYAVFSHDVADASVFFQSRRLVLSPPLSSIIYFYFSR